MVQKEACLYQGCVTWEATFEHPIDNPETSKRLLQGSLVIFVEDLVDQNEKEQKRRGQRIDYCGPDYGFIYATVVKTPETGRRVTVTPLRSYPYCNSFKMSRDGWSGSLINMLEVRTYFEAYRPVLETLQRMKAVPLAHHLLKACFVQKKNCLKVFFMDLRIFFWPGH